MFLEPQGEYASTAQQLFVLPRLPSAPSDKHWSLGLNGTQQVRPLCPSKDPWELQTTVEGSEKRHSSNMESSQAILCDTMGTLLRVTDLREVVELQVQ